jgi:sugar/nucleoside kinase (ribokinase family)
MDRAYDVLVVGEINVDLILSGDIEPVFGQVEKRVENAVLTVGSSSVIFACGAAWLGLKVAFTGVVGDDLYGHYMLDRMRARGIETGNIILDRNQRTGLSVILSRKGERAILTYAGAIDALSADQIDRGLMKKCSHMHVASYYLQSSLRPDIPFLFAEAREHGLTISLDTNWDPSEVWDGEIEEALCNTDVFLPNEQEAIAISKSRNVEDALDKLSSYIGTVAIKRGSKGAIAQSGGEKAVCKAFPAEVVDATGAGDSFDAGFIYGMLKGFSLLESLQYGCVCGSFSTKAFGGVESQPTLSEVRESLRKYPRM